MITMVYLEGATHWMIFGEIPLFFLIVLWTIRSVQNVQNDRTHIFGLTIFRNTQYGVTSYLYIMISLRIFRQKSACYRKLKMKNGSPMGPQAKPPGAK